MQTDDYATEEESRAVVRPEPATLEEVLEDERLDNANAFEQGAGLINWSN